MPKPYRSPDRGRYQRIRMESMYLPMRDGVRLAVDVYFPEPFDLNRKYPALLHQTRYWRLPELRWPFSLLSNGLLGHTGGYVKELVLNGFVFVNVDSRGSGASFGQREYPWGPDEVKDGSDMADWIVEQSWSNGKIGGVGISYTGTTAEFLLANQHPAVKAAMPLFSLYDVYDDIAFPGGVPHDGFVLNWGKANGQLDRNEFPLKNPIAQLMVKGVKPVGGKKGRKELAAAVEDHKGNRQVSETSEGVIYRDQTPKTGVVESMADFSPHHFRENIGGGGAALYSASGWMDGGYQHAAVKRWRNASNPVNKLMLGPWDHGARFHITPGQERTMDLDVVDEAVKYFDHFLKDYATGILDEPPVHYYTMQEEKWKMADQWPPAGLQSQTYYFHAEGNLLEGKPEPGDHFDTVVQDSRIGTGEYTRWRGLIGQMSTGKLYPDRKFKDKQLLTFDSFPLVEDVEHTGHALARLYVRSNVTDAAFFVYLEDITPGGEVRHVTEGLLRALHRKVSDDAPVYEDSVPYHSFKEKDAAPMKIGEVTELCIDLLPVSYLFKKGHRIRIAVSTGDKDNFRQLCPDGSKFALLRSRTYPSRIELPVMPRS